MANDKRFIAKNGFLTSDADSSFTNSTSATPTVTFTNSGGAGASSLPGSGAVIAKFVGDSDAMVLTNISGGDYFFGNNQQNNGINFYDGTGGMEFYYNGVEKFSIDSNGTTFATGHTTNGTTTTNRLLVEDNGSSSPLVVIKADDQGPWALTIGNDTYSTTELMGHLFYQADVGDVYYQTRGNGVYENWNFQQHDGSTARIQMRIASTGNIELASNHYVLWGVGDTNRPGFLGDNTNKVLQFHNNGSERMRLDGSGNVGIGTQTATSGRVHVHGGNVRITNTSDVGLKLRHTSATYDFNILQNSNGDLELNYGTIDFVRIKSSGNVGIGSNANNPQYKLDVDGTSRVTGGLTISPGSGGHTSFELGSRSADPLPASTGSYDFKPGMRVGSYETGAVNAAANIALAWATNDVSTSSAGYLATGPQTYATASFALTFNVPQVAGTRWFCKVKLNDAESGNDPRVAINGGTEYRFEYLDAVNASGEAVNDSDTWHVFDVTDDIVTGTNTLKAWLGAGQKTYILAAYVFASTGIALPNEPAESTFYAHDGFGVQDTLIIDKFRNMTNINSVRFETPSTSGGNKNYFANVGTGGQDYWIMSTSNANGSLGGGKFAIGTDAVSGNNAAQTRLLIDSNGNVGIGTTNPSNLLTVDTNAAATTSDSISVRNRGITATGHTVGLRFQYNTAVPSAIRTVNTNISSGAGRLGLFTSPDGTAGNLDERLSILSNGFVGIGVTTPQKTLDVLSPLNGFVTVARQMSVGSYSGIHFGYSEPTNSSYRKSAIVFERTDLTSNDAQGKIHILNGPQGNSGSATLADAKITIAENGNVGIGDTSPDRKLHVTSASNQVAVFETTLTSDMAIELRNSQGSMFFGLDGSENFGIGTDWDLNGANGKFTVTNAGLVGINRVSPRSTLEINETGNFNFIQMVGAAGQYTGLKLARGDGTWSSTANNQFGMLVTDRGLEITKLTSLGDNTTGRLSNPYIQIETDTADNVGIGATAFDTVIEKTSLSTNATSKFLINYTPLLTDKFNEITGSEVWGAVEPKPIRPSRIRSTSGTNVGTAYINSFGSVSSSVVGEADLSAIDADAQFTFAAAWAALETHGARMPTLSEIMAGCGYGSGQGYDSEFLWTQTFAGPHHVWVCQGAYNNNGANGAKIVDITDPAEVYRTRGFFDASHKNMAVHYDNNESITTNELMARGDVTAYYSDERLKDFHGTIPDALDKVNRVNGYLFTENELAKQLGYNNDRVQAGVSAQEIEAVMPEVVKEAPINEEKGTDYKTVQYDRLVPLLIEAIKELSTKVDLQQQEIERLKDL